MSHISKEKKDLKAMIVLFKSYKSVLEFVKEDIKKYNLDINTFSVFEVIYHKKELSVQEIKNKVLVASSSLTYILNKLETLNLIERTKCISDKRIILVKLTKEGLKQGNEIFIEHYQNLKKIFNILTEEEKQIYIELSKKIGYHAEEIKGELK